MSFQGQIASLALGDVVQNLVINKKTGTLSIESRQLECHIQFEKGDIVSYTDNRGIEISKWLVDKEIVSPKKMEDALRKYRRSKKKSLGATLRDQKSISLEEYKTHLIGLLGDGLCEALSLQEGTFEFREGALNDKHSDREVRALGIKLSAQNLIMEAARRSDDYANIRRHLPAESEIYCASRSERQHILETSDDDITRAAIGLLDGGRSIKEVIAKLPCTRFEAIRCIAALVAGKKVRPLDSSQLVARNDADPRESIERLKTVLEREPGNRQVHRKLASLYEQLGLREESAKHHKMLANTFLDDRDLEKAKAELERSVELSPKDTLAWQKLWDVHCRVGDDEQILDFGKKYLAHFKEMGFMEIVRDHLLKLIDRYPDKNTFKLELAKAYVALGEHKAATQGLLEVGNELLSKNRYEEAEKVFALILKFDHKNEKARKVCEEIQTGKLKKRRAFLRKLTRDLTFLGAGLLAVLFVIRELFVQNEYLTLMREVLAEQVMETRSYDEARHRIDAIRGRHWLSPTAAGQGAALLHALSHKRDEHDRDTERGSGSSRRYRRRR